MRTYHPEVPPRVEYEISELGHGLAPLFAALADWSVNLGKVEQARQDYETKEQRPLRAAPYSTGTQSGSPTTP